MGGVHEKVIYWRELSKKGGGAWTFCRFKGRLSKKKGGRGGWGGWMVFLIPKCTLCLIYPMVRFAETDPANIYLFKVNNSNTKKKK